MSDTPQPSLESSGGGVKEVKVSLSPIDEKALSRTRRAPRKSRKNAAAEDQAGGGEFVPQIERVPADPAPAAPIQNSAPAAVPPPVPAAPIISVEPAAASQGGDAPKAALAPTSVVGGGPVKIAAKRHAVTTTTPISSVVAPTAATGGARILPTKKRISAAPAAQTFKKPRFVVGSQPQAHIASPPPTPAPKKRRFTERRISISMQPSATTRKHRRHLKDRIAAMPIAAVRRMLLQKGLLKPKATQPPEEMMRSMLKDYLLLHAAE